MVRYWNYFASRAKNLESSSPNTKNNTLITWFKEIRSWSPTDCLCRFCKKCFRNLGSTPSIYFFKPTYKFTELPWNKYIFIEKYFYKSYLLNHVLFSILLDFRHWLIYSKLCCIFLDLCRFSSQWKINC